MFALAARDCRNAVPALLDAVKTGRAGVRKVGIEALGSLADGSISPDLVQMLKSDRFAAERSVTAVPVTIQGREQIIHVKFGLLNGDVFSLKAEYDEISALAREAGIPLRELARIVESRAWSLIGKSD